MYFKLIQFHEPNSGQGGKAESRVPNLYFTMASVVIFLLPYTHGAQNWIQHPVIFCHDIMALLFFTTRHSGLSNRTQCPNFDVIHNFFCLKSICLGSQDKKILRCHASSIFQTNKKCKTS